MLMSSNNTSSSNASREKTAKSFIENLPDYLQLDIDGGARACAEAIDECLLAFSQNATASAAVMMINGTHAQRLEKDLRTLGFESARLSQAELVSFSKIR